MREVRKRHVSTAVSLVACLLGTASAAGPSRDISSYVLFGNDGIRARGLHITSGDVGVNQRALLVHDAVDGPGSTLAGDVVSVGGRSRCAELFFSSAVTHAAPQCGPGTQFQGPLIDDLAAACGFPDEFPDCSGGSAIDVAAGDQRTLPPGVYGDVDVGGAASRHGRLVLTGGRYVFCSLRVRRGAAIDADSASQVFVAGDVSIGPKSRLGPSDDVAAGDLTIFSKGRQFSVSRNAEVTARVCAPNATLHVTGGATLTGLFAADRVVASRITLTGLPSESTTTTSTTTTTSSTSTTTTSASTTTTSTTTPSTSTTSSTSTTTTSSSTATTSTGPSSTTTTTSTSSTTSSTPSTTTVQSTTSTTSTTGPTTSTTTTIPTTTTSSTTTSTTATLPTTSTTTTTAATSSSTTATPPTTTTTSTTTTSAPTTTTAGATTTTSTSSTTTTTGPPITSCPAGGQVDVITTLVPDANTYVQISIGGIEVDVGYPASVSIPGSGLLPPLGDPTDPATLIVLLSASPDGINLYDGTAQLFDADTASPFALKTDLALNPTANLFFFQAVPFERARFTCTPGTALSAGDFICTVPQEVTSIATAVPPEQRPACVVTLDAP